MKNHKPRILVFCLCVLILLQTATGQETMNSYISNLMARMTLDEKIGQLNLPSVGFDVTGPIVSKDVDEKIRKGEVGGVFNTFTPVAVRKLQELAVKGSALLCTFLFLFGYGLWSPRPRGHLHHPAGALLCTGLRYWWSGARK